MKNNSKILVRNDKVLPEDIRGVNLGGWLLMEGYILHGRNIAESQFKREFKKINGDRELAEFEKLFRDTFITETDIRNIARMGAKTIRVPFNYRLIERNPYKYDLEGLSYLAKILQWSKDHGLKAILDLHAACGAQNADWHGDSDGAAHFWEKRIYRERTIALWETVAYRFKGHSALLGYDLINEPVLERGDLTVLKDFYRDAIRRIRGIDKEKVLFIEGNIWAQQIDFLADIIEENVWISIHTYCPLSYTFNFVPFYHFPGTIDGERWDSAKTRKYLEPYRRFAEKNRVNIFVGEFGVNWRGGYFGELDWLESMLKTFDDFGFGYTYWTYKAIANSVFPDGIYQYVPNGNYVKREGPVYGFENYYSLWRKEKDQIVEFWRTGNYTPNQALIHVLRKHFTRNGK